MPEYAFDVNLYGSIRVMAKNVDEAEFLLREHINCADTNFGSWPNGDPILGEVSLFEDKPELMEIDGEPVE